jgi:hypothetical protein
VSKSFTVLGKMSVSLAVVAVRREREGLINGDSLVLDYH